MGFIAIVGAVDLVAELPCGEVYLRVVAEGVPQSYNSARLRTDLESSWSGVIKKFHVSEVLAEPETVLELRGPKARAFKLNVEGRDDSFTIEIEDVSLASCALAKQLAQDFRVRSRFPRVIWACSSDAGFVALGEKVHDLEVSSAESPGLIVEITERDQLPALHRCAILVKKVTRQPGEIVVAVVSDTRVDYLNGVAWGDTSTMDVVNDTINAICLPDGGYKDWVAAHELGHVLLDSTVHPCEYYPECEENLLVLENPAGSLTHHQLDRIWAESIDGTKGDPIIRGCGDKPRWNLDGEACLAVCSGQ